MEQVVKRDGRIVDFDPTKIVDAVLAAMKETGLVDIKLANQIAEEIDLIPNRLSVEAIQDMVEEKLMASDRKDVAKRYILYRAERTKQRNRKTLDLFTEIVNAEANDVTRENANMNADTPAGMMMKFASEASKSYTIDELLSQEAIEYIEANKLHVHDMDYYPTKSLTCIQHPLNKIISEGFRAGHGVSRPAKRIETASILGCISMESVQNEMHGGQAIPAFDYYMAPYVWDTYLEECEELMDLFDFTIMNLPTPKEYVIKEVCKPVAGSPTYYSDISQIAINRTVKRVHQAMEAFIHNCNTIHSRGGNQVVFSSINYGTDDSPEGRCVIRELLNATYRGVGNGETPIFPIQIWKLKAGISADPGDPNYDLYQLACKVTAKRFFPNFLNLDATFNQHEDWDEKDPSRFKWEVACMGCRTRVFENRHGKKTSIGRGNLSFSTINLVRCALEAAQSEDDVNARINVFYNLLDDCMDVAARQLFQRYRFQCSGYAKQFPMLMSGLWNGSDKLDPNDKVEPVLSQGTLGIGFIGLAEALIALIGKHHGESNEAQQLGLEIVAHMRERVTGYANSYDLNYSLLATPAEGLSGKFTKRDRKKFGVIKNITDKEFYTNSNHVPVWYKCSVQHKADVEAPYHEMTRGGHIFYVELDGDATHNPKAIDQVNQACRQRNMGYWSENHTRVRCLDCGYEEASKDLTECPVCHSNNMDILQRITGYLVGSVGRWNSAKKDELNHRVTHT